MSQPSKIIVNIETQKILHNIQDITQKIKRELMIINEMIRDKGNVTEALTEANSALVQTAKELGIKSIDELLTFDESDEKNMFGVLSVDDITQKLMSVMDT
ncbi:hypothetical protein PV327_009217 [Microctonus hyperodae]|uniref:Uncharacterized protein n=1 Tax=Microctonus hyperodae TaxID=165561 RepID=A0AA39FTC2_MICHY|nr:hypothetical protein PV327_009217 [Microctonus hyperodae]